MLEIKGNQFYLDGEKFHIYAGAIHYFRTVPEYWEDRLRKLKLAGFNTVETYVCWNLHEPKKGVFDFSGMLDIVRFLRIAQELGLYAIVRPGPYICAEWDFGGLPAWLLADENMRVRCCYEPYLKHVSDFYHELFSRIQPMLLSNGGNILAVQVENEYGSYGNDKNYLAFIEQLIRECGVDTLLFTSDGANDAMLTGGTLPYVFKVVNFGSNVKGNFKAVDRRQPGAPLMCGEFWNGWFDHWGERHHHRRPRSVVNELKTMLQMGGNFSFYMFHGGTNFGFTAGANHGGKYQPTVTSYDDDALLNEWGGYTKKYHAVREVLLAFQGIPAEPLPAPPALQNIGPVALTQQYSFLHNATKIGKRHRSVMTRSMEYYGQNFGFILYHHDLKGPYEASKLFIDGLADRAYVYVNGQLRGMVYRNDKKKFVSIEALPDGGSLDILVEAMGRVNYGPELHDRKGVRQIRLNNQVLFNWDVYTLPLDNIDALDYSGSEDFPAFLKGCFTTNSQADCFVHLKGFTKGYVFINGFNLGRYWKIGPQKSLYVPGTILKQENEIIVLELEGCRANEVEITDYHDIG